jgi:hypothetical protein
MATAAILPIISGLAGLFGGKGQQQSSSGTQQQIQNMSTSGRSSTTPNLNPLQQKLAEMFSSKAMDFANQAPDLTGYTQGGIENINQANAGSQAATRNMLAARGLAYSPAYATATTMGDQNRTNQISQFLASIPLLQRQLQQQGIGGLEQAFGAQPFGTTSESQGGSTGNTEGSFNSTGTQSGNPVAGALSGIGAALGAPSIFGGGGSQLGDILASLGFGKPKAPYSYQGPPVPSGYQFGG